MNSYTKFKVPKLLSNWTQNVDRLKSTSKQTNNGRSSKNTDVNKCSTDDLNMNCFACGTNAKYMEYLFSKWVKDETSVHVSWHKYFAGIFPKSDEEDNRAKAFPGALSDLFKLEEDKK
ncbi:uncharacterized protein LOC111518717 [Drosophila willistoni]|uniref:uncharacterized protein LOC111518717 n=1 Tax=Drosophila willistoni TaxID=7260 RepID=UPI001F071C98|nr:uncharacterized protein LOC111518717 [Drosophila willistoni]